MLRPLSACMNEHSNVQDLDKLFFDKFPTNELSSILTADVTLCNRRVVSREKQGVTCIIDSPLLVFISDGKKRAFAEGVMHGSHHLVLNVSNSVGRFLATSEGRRVHGRAAIEALMEAGLEYVTVENFAQKSPVQFYGPLFADNSDGGRFKADLGLNLRLYEEGQLAVLVERAREEGQVGKIRVRKMFCDLLVRRYNLAKAGSVEWLPVAADGPVVLGNLRVTKVKVYPAFIHVVKSLQHHALLHLPRKYRQVRIRTQQVAALVERLTSPSSTELDAMRHVRIEVSVAGRGKVEDIRATSRELTPFLLELAARLSTAPVQLADVVRSAQGWLAYANDTQTFVGRDSDNVTPAAKCHIAHVMNEVGLATRDVGMHLGEVGDDGWYEWEDRGDGNIEPPDRFNYEELIEHGDQMEAAQPPRRHLMTTRGRSAAAVADGRDADANAEAAGTQEVASDDDDDVDDAHLHASHEEDDSEDEEGPYGPIPDAIYTRLKLVPGRRGWVTLRKARGSYIWKSAREDEQVDLFKRAWDAFGPRYAFELQCNAD